MKQLYAWNPAPLWELVSFRKWPCNFLDMRGSAVGDQELRLMSSSYCISIYDGTVLALNNFFFFFWRINVNLFVFM